MVKEWTSLCLMVSLGASCAPSSVLGDPVLRRRYDGGGERGLGEEWWPKDPEASKDMAYQFFIHRVPGHSLRDGFSEAKLREIFPNLFGRGSGETLQEVPHRSRMSLSSL
ncbi:unnamed protein product [Durusdinium trenchii]